MAENVNSTNGGQEIDYKAEYEKLQGDHAKLKASFDKASTEVSSYKKQLAEKQTDEEKAQADLEAREARYKAIERENLLYKTKQSLSKFIKDEKIADKLAEYYADGEIAKALELTASHWASATSELEKTIQAELMKRNPEGHPQTTGASLTKDQIMAISDSEERQKAMAQNWHLFKNN